MFRLKFFVLLLLPSFHAMGGLGEFVHCYDYGCKSTRTLSFSAGQWQSIKKLFIQPTSDAWSEKQKIRQTIALMEQYAGSLTGTNQDRGGNYSGGGNLSGQQDCIDESTNTMQYLHALEQRNLLKYHSVSGNVKRSRWLMFEHWTAVIEQLDTGQLYAVDSWYRDNGQPPYVQKLEEWEQADSFPDALNP